MSVDPLNSVLSKPVENVLDRIKSQAVLRPEDLIPDNTPELSRNALFLPCISNPNHGKFSFKNRLVKQK